MIGISKEMADRFIEFVLKFFKGESVEDQLTKAIKLCVAFISVLLFCCFSLLVTNLNLRMNLADAEAGLAKINVLFDAAGSGPISGFIRINTALSRQMDLIKEQNVWLIKKSTKLSSENTFLKRHLLSVLEENQLLKKNNDLLIAKCNP